MSLCAIGTPCSGPSVLPRRCAVSAASAAARAPALSTSTKQFSVLLSRPMRSRQASTTSRAVALPAAMASAVSVSEARDQSALADWSVIARAYGKLQQGGAKVVRVGVEVDLGVGRFHGLAQLLELDWQLLDPRRLEPK